MRAGERAQDHPAAFQKHRPQRPGAAARTASAERSHQRAVVTHVGQLRQLAEPLAQPELAADARCESASIRLLLELRFR